MKTSQTVEFPPRVINDAVAHTRVLLGALPITIVSGGYISLPAKVLAPNADPTERAAFFEEFSLPDDIMQMHMNHYVIDEGARRILIDVGDGGRFRGATSGRLENGLTAADIAENSITDIVLTHGHSDHVLALADGGASLYPQAKFYLHAREHDYWYDETILSAADEAKQDVILRVRNALDGIADRTVIFSAEYPLSDACTIVETHGHTPGHCSVLVRNAGEKLLITGDIFNHFLANFTHPEWALGADVDADQAVKTRLYWLARATDENIRLGAFHFPFPGLGYVRRSGAGFEFLPALWAWSD